MLEEKSAAASKEVGKSHWEKQAKAHCDKGEDAEAIIYYDKILAVDPKDASVWALRGNSNRMLKRYEEAISDFNESIKLNPENSWAWARLGYAKFDLCRYEEAIQDCNEAIKLNPKNEYAWCVLGGVKRELRRYEEAIQDLNEAIRLNPEADKFAWWARGNAKQNLGHYDEAISDFDELIKLDPKYHFAWIGRIESKKALGRNEEVFQDCVAFIKLNGEEDWVKKQLESTKKELEDAKKMRAELDEIIKKVEVNMLTELEFCARKLDDTGAQVLALALPKFSALTKLDLSNNNIGVAGMKALATILPQCRSLTHLSLGYNNMGDAGVQAVAVILPQCQKLRVLELPGNGISSEGVKTLVVVLAKCGLVELGLSGNKIDSRGMQYLSEVLPKCTGLMRLEIASCGIGDVGAQALLNVLSFCSLIYMGTGWRGVSANLEEKIISALKQNKSRHDEKKRIQDSEKSIKIDSKSECVRGELSNVRGSFALSDSAKKPLEEQQKELEDAKQESWSQAASDHCFKGEYLQAIFYYDKMIAANPQDDYPWWNRASVKQKLGRGQEAIQDLNEALRLNPTNDWTKKLLLNIKKTQAELHLDKKEYTEAISCYDEMFALDPTDKSREELLNLKKSRAALHFISQEYAEAVPCYDIVLALDAKDALSLEGRGSAKRMLGQYEEAVKDLEEAIKLNPTSDWAKKELSDAKEAQQRTLVNNRKLQSLHVGKQEGGDVVNEIMDWSKKASDHYFKREYLQAISYYDKMIDVNPQDDYAWWSRGSTKRMMGRYEEAIYDCDVAIKLNPKNHASWQERGAAYNSLERYEEAIRDLEEAIRLNPPDDWARKQLLIANNGQKKILPNSWKAQAKLHFDKQEFDKAIELYNKILEVDSTDGFALAARGASKRMLAQYDEAMNDLKDAIRLTHDNAWMRRELITTKIAQGGFHFNNEEYAKAIICYDEALIASPKDAFALQNRGSAKRMLKQYEAAVQDLEEALALDPESSWARKELVFAKEGLKKERAEVEAKKERQEWRALARSSYDKGQYVETIFYCDKVFAVEGKDSSLLKLRAAAHVELSRHKEAILDFDELVKLEPGNVSVWVNRGKSNFALAHYGKAIQDFDEVIKLNPGNYSAWQERGAANNFLERYEEAIRDLEEAIRLNPPNAWARKELSRAKEGQQKMLSSNWKTKASDHYFKGEYLQAISYYDKMIDVNPQDDYAWWSRASAKRMLGRYEEAIHDSDLAIKLNPKNYSAWQERGAAYNSLERYEEAIRDLEEAIRLNPPDDWARKQLLKAKEGEKKALANSWKAQAALHFNKQEYSEAIFYYDKVLALDPKDDFALQTRGNAKRILGCYDEAMQDFTQAVKLNPENTEAKKCLKNELLRAEEILKDAEAKKERQEWRVLARSSYDKGQYVETISYCDKVFAVEGKDSSLLKLRAAAHVKLSRHKEAILDFDELVKLEPGNVSVWINRGKSNFALAHYGKAIQDFDEVIKLNPGNYSAWQERGAANNFLERYEEAIRDLEEAIRLNPRNDWARKELSRAKEGQQKVLSSNWKAQASDHYFKGEYLQAISYYDKMIDVNPQDDYAWWSRASTKRMLRRYEEAIHDCDVAIKLNPKNYSAWQERGAAYNSLERYEEAIRDLEEAIRLNPSNDWARKVLSQVKDAQQKVLPNTWKAQALLHFNKEEYAEAIVCYNKVLVLDPSDDFALRYRGSAKRMMKNYQEAIYDCDSAIKLNPGNHFAWQERGAAYNSLERYDEAIRDLEEAIKLNPPNDWARKVLSQAKEAQQKVLLKRNSMQDKNSNKVEAKLKDAKAEKFESEKQTPQVLVKSLYDKGQYVEAILYCDKVFAAKGKDSALLKLRASANVKLSHPEEAILDFSELVKLEPNNADVWVERGKLKFQLARYEEAIQDFMEVVKLSPHNAYAKECLKEARRKLKDETSVSTPTLIHPKLQDNNAFSAPSPSSPVFGHKIKASMAIAKEKLTFEQKLGEGSFGEVYKGGWKPTSLFTVPVAIKKLKNASLSTKILEDFKREVEVQAQLDSSGVVKLFGITSEQPYCMVMEFMEQGSLRDVLDSQQPEDLHWDIRLQMAGNMARGLAYLHGNDPIIIHGDLKSLNILVNAKGEAKLADFGLAALKTETRSKEYVGGNADKNKGPKGSLLWIAPELYRMNAMRTTATDIFSFAVVLWELASHLLPYQSAEGNEALIKDWVTSGEREAFDERTPNTPKQYSDLAQRCWDAKPENRFSAQDVVVELEELYSKTQLAPTLFSSSSKLSPTPPRRQSMNSEGYIATTGSGPVPVKSSSGYLVKSVNSPSQSPTASPKVPPRKPTTGGGGFLAKSTKPSPTASPQTPPKGSPYKGNVYK